MTHNLTDYAKYGIITTMNSTATSEGNPKKIVFMSGVQDDLRGMPAIVRVNVGHTFG